MPDPTFVAKLNEQIGNEFAASQQYIAVAVHYSAEMLPRLASFFFRQSLEERNHALMMVQYLLDADAPVEIPAVQPPHNGFTDVVEPVRLALEQEKEVGRQIGELARIAREHDDYASEQFMQWFLKEQVEEVSSMNDLLKVVTRGKDDPLRVEEFLARESIGDAGEPDPSAPPVAGGLV